MPGSSINKIERWRLHTTSFVKSNSYHVPPKEIIVHYPERCGKKTGEVTASIQLLYGDNFSEWCMKSRNEMWRVRRMYQSCNSTIMFCDQKTQSIVGMQHSSVYFLYAYNGFWGALLILVGFFNMSKICLAPHLLKLTLAGWLGQLGSVHTSLTIQHLIPDVFWWQWKRKWEKVKVKAAQSCPTLCDPMDYTVHAILLARILEWVAFPFSRGSSQPRDRTQVSHIADGIYTSWATKEVTKKREGMPNGVIIFKTLLSCLLTSQRRSYD